MKLLSIGFGSIGRRHVSNARALRPGAQWTVVEPARDLWKPEEARFVATLDEAVGPFDAAFINSPTSMHAEHVEALVDRALALFIEKPLAHDRASLARIEAVLASRAIPTMIGCNYRFEAGLGRVCALLEDGAIGKPLTVRAEFGQWLPSWRPHTDYRAGYAAHRSTGGGVILDRIHELDYVAWLFGVPTEVKAMSGKLSTLEIETEDTADILLRFPSGAIGSVHVDYLQREYTCSMKIVGERGSIEWRFKPTSVRVLREAGAWETVFSDPAPDVNAMYVAELEHFFSALAAGTAPANGIAEAARVTEVALEAQEAA